MKKNIFSYYLPISVIILFFQLDFCAFADAPIDNPVATFYKNSQYAAEGYPAWIDDIKWNNVIDMSTYSNGANDFEKFENARDLVYSQGGGVLYYPAGIYNFSNHPTGPNGRGLMLKKGVVIRGQAPASNSWAVKDINKPTDDSGLSDLQTVFIFPTYDKKTSPASPELIVRDGEGIVPRDWNHIGLAPVSANGEHIRDVNNIGICWVKLQYATVYFGGDFDWDATAKTYATAGAWKSASAKTTNEYGQNWASRVPDGTHPFDPFTGAAPGKYLSGCKNRLVFGCRFENAVVHDDIWGHGNLAETKMYGYFGSRFVGRVVVYGENIFVANNIIPKPTKCFLFDMNVKVIGAGDATTLGLEITGTGSSGSSSNQIRTVMYDYARSIGFDINKSLASQRENRCVLEADINKSSLYSDNVVVQDNYTYQHGNKGYEMAGKWFVLKRNVRTGNILSAYNHCYKCGNDIVSDNVYGLTPNVNFIGGKYRGWFNSLDGGSDCKYTDDNMSRAMDLAGWNSWFDANYWDQTGSNPGVDGEGLLYQAQGCVEVFSVAETNNKQGICGGSAGGYIAPYNVHLIGMLQGWNDNTRIGSYCKSGDRHEDISIVGNTNTIGIWDCTAGDVKDWFKDADCSSTPITAPSNLLVVYDANKKCNIVKWTDNATNEVGFKVERRELGQTQWSTVCFRPRNQTGGISGTDPITGQSNPTGWVWVPTDLSAFDADSRCANQNIDINTQDWRDYLIASGKQYEYRVIAMGCDQSDLSASSVPVSVTKTDFIESIIDGIFLYPVPLSENLNIRIENKYIGDLNVSVVDMNGRKIKTFYSAKTQDVLNLTCQTNEILPGIYFINVAGGDRFFYSCKVIKK